LLPLRFLALGAIRTGVAHRVAPAEPVIVSIERNTTDTVGLPPTEITAEKQGLPQADADSSTRWVTLCDVAGPSDPRSRKRPTRTVGQMLPTVLSELGLTPAAQGVRVLQVWDEALGEFAPYCRPDGIRNGTLVARVPDSAWMQRLQLEKPQILGRLEELLGEPVAQEIRFRISPAAPPPTGGRGSRDRLGPSG
jgi:predicted nucleic acid-binding Zn ribbon protein